MRIQALYYNVYTSLMADPNLYFTTLIIIVVALLPDVLIQVHHHPCHHFGLNHHSRHGFFIDCNK